MAGDQHLGAVARLVPDERCQEMLAVPEGEDRRHRSEERRVGKECRARWGPEHYKKKDIEGCCTGVAQPRQSHRCVRVSGQSSMACSVGCCVFFFFKQKTAYEIVR